MKELESLAAQAFERYTLMTSGRKANWTYLSEERKEAWMMEMIFFIEHISNRLKGKFKAVAPTNSTAGAYSAGYNDGVATERLSIMNFIDMLDTEYIAQLEEYKAQVAEKKRRNRLTSE